MKIAIYARVSTDKQDAENQGLQLREFAEKQSWKVFDEYVDTESGSTAARPAFQRMLKDASQRKFDMVLFWSLDRLSREGVLPTLKHLETITSYGVGWRSFTEQFFDSCGVFKDAIISIMATNVLPKTLLSPLDWQGFLLPKTVSKTNDFAAPRNPSVSLILFLKDPKPALDF